jgi:hypothetical protein
MNGKIYIEAENMKYKVHNRRVAFQSMRLLLCFLLLTAYCLLLSGDGEAYVDRVVAFVDDEAITLSELDRRFEDIRQLSPHSKKEQVLDSLINRKMLLREAKKYRMEAPTEEEIINEYIDLKIRAYIRVLEADIEQFYRDNSEQFSGKGLGDVRDEIETYLTEKEVNERLITELRKLRTGSYIKIQLRADENQ